MSQADSETREWLETLDEGQVRAIAHQIGLPWTDVPAEFRASLQERKRFKKVKRIRETHYV